MSTSEYHRASSERTEVKTMKRLNKRIMGAVIVPTPSTGWIGIIPRWRSALKDVLYALYAVLPVVGFGCGADAIPSGLTSNPGQTTPSDATPDFAPPIPKPTSPLDIRRSVSDSVQTTIEPLATDFRPAVLAVTGHWVVGRSMVGKTNTAITGCARTVADGRVNSANILFPVRKQECDLLSVGWNYVVYPDQGRAISVWLRSRYDNELAPPAPATAFRPLLVRNGEIQPGALVSGLIIPYSAGEDGRVYVGDWSGILENGCELDGAVGPNALPCRWAPTINASVQQVALTNPVYIRRDVFWQKEGDSEVIINDENLEITETISRTFKVGTERTQTTAFGRSVSANLGVDAKGIEAGVAGTLEQTFGTSISLTTAYETTKTREIRVAGRQTAVVELWNLIEQYSFANADSSVYEDPNYLFVLSDLTRSATVATALVSVSFPN